MLLFSIIILFTAIRPSYQTVYSCNATASCGCSPKPISVSRIVGGEIAAPQTWTWAVSISIDNTYLCGGTILSSSWILTAAHCVVGNTASQITIYAGSTTRFSGVQIKVASQIFTHPYYQAGTHENDIALLQLSSPLNMNDPNIGAICIPSVSSATLAAGEWPSIGTSVVAVGWGLLSEGGSSSLNLQQVSLSTIGYQSSTCRPSVNDKKIQFCAGVNGGGKDTCQGDSGGPLMMFTPSKQWVLVGVTSYGEGCARPTSAGVYTRVAAYESWIKSITGGSYSPIPLSHANTIQLSMWSIASLVVLFSIKFFW